MYTYMYTVHVRVDDLILYLCVLIYMYVCVCLSFAGLCKVEPTPKGWFIEYIDRSPDALSKQAVSFASTWFETLVLFVVQG